MHSIVKVTAEGDSILDTILQTLIPDKLVLFLNTLIIKTPIIFINYWSVVHVVVGFLWFLFFKTKWWVFFGISFSFEVTEFLLGGYTNSPLWVEETIDIVWDMIFNMLGYFLAYFLLKKK